MALVTVRFPQEEGAVTLGDGDDVVPQDASKVAMPRRPRRCFMSVSGKGLLDVLNLFADLFEFCFRLDDDLGDSGVVRLRADGVELAE